MEKAYRDHVNDTAKDAGPAWHRNSLSHAPGEPVLSGDQGSPLVCSDIVSFLQRAGGGCIRPDKAGIAPIGQGTVTEEE